MTVTIPTPEAFVEREYDYVIVGGGTAGLVLAARLSEDPDITVGVLEAGGYYPDEPLINVPGYFGRSMGNPEFDWAFLTVPQKHLNGRPIFHPRGKLLGGSSAINFMATGRASKEEYDAFESVGNPGWNWNEFLKYMKKSETVHAAENGRDPELNITFDPEAHGTSGPIQKSYSPWVSGLSIPFFETLESFGIKRNPDSSAGLASGSYTILGTIDPKTAKRSYSTDYITPNASRPNLTILTNAHATKVVLSGTAEPYLVTGIQFTAGSSNTVYEVKVRREVVLSAGAFGTPQLLELSGIGSHDVLDRFDIPVKVELPGVGENLQDHIYTSTTYEVDPVLDTLDALRDPEISTAAETSYANEAKGMLASTHSAFAFLPAEDIMPQSEIARMKRELDDNTATLTSTPALRKQKKLLQTWFDDSRHPQIEVITYPGFFPAPGKTPRPGAHYHTVLVALMHPLSRGSVHIVSGSPTDKPAVDPQYLSNDIDRDILVHGVRFTKKLQDAEPMRGLTHSYVEPAWEDDGEEQLGEDELREYVRNAVEPVYHPACTAAMYPREDGGVVDSGLKVYGTTNLRIADASVFPFHIAAHPQTTIYGLAEKLADIIKDDARLPIPTMTWWDTIKSWLPFA